MKINLNNWTIEHLGIKLLFGVKKLNDTASETAQHCKLF